MQLIVLGMHRSGTSVVTRLLNMMGAYFAPEGASTLANAENPKGFWERRDIRDCNDNLLFSIDVDWNKVFRFDLSKISRQSEEKYQKEISKIVLELDANRPWVVKEPRLCLLFPLWKKLLEVPVCIHIYRNPVEVAQSLERRNGIPLSAGLALWEIYNIRALAATEGLPRLLISYSDIMADPRSVVCELYKELENKNVTGIRMPSEREIGAFITAELRHHHLGDRALGGFVNDAQRGLYRALETRKVFTRKSPYKLSPGGKNSIEYYEKCILDLLDKGKIVESMQKQLLAREKELTSSIESHEESKVQHEQLRDQHQNLLIQHQNLLSQHQNLLSRYQEHQLKLKKTEYQNKAYEGEIGKVMCLMNQVQIAATSVFESKSWRSGRLLVGTLGKALLKPTTTTSEDTISKIFDTYTHWRDNLTQALSVKSVENMSLKYIKGSLEVDIVVCVHNALEDVRKCLTSIEENTARPYSIYIVDDGSQDETREFVANYAQTRDYVTLWRNSVAQGYTKAANKGLKLSIANYVVLLNSDTVVPRNWTQALIECAESNWQIGIVGPLSNAASWQSVPKVFEVGSDWAVNKLPEGFTVNDMAELIYWVSKSCFPRVPILNGFCMLIKRSVIDVVGYFDEEVFPNGYGEENDYCLRAAKAGFVMAVADHLYVYHSKSKSYTHERRRVLATEGQEALREKHQDIELGEFIKELRNQPVLANLRKAIDARLSSGSYQ